ncbi:MAG: folate-binding protein [Proteobacteria bacterium]|jgi:folate-binding protein YgfZ|nr:folate-binding protein YgfZ [Ramlibacter sp.]MCA0212718.1 folate-binding protein [Pseudomonadota bacterium]
MTHELNGVATLTHLGVIRVQGEDAARFLQGQLTQDFMLLGDGQARLAAFCSPKGRMQASFVGLRRGPDEVLLVCSLDILAPVLKRLSMFVLRAKAKLTDATADFTLHGLAGTSCPAIGTQAPWERADDGAASLVALYPAAGQARALWIAPVGHPAPPGPALGLDGWLWGEVMSGIATITAPIVDAFVPQMLNYESVGGVNFRKGCYPGQEVVARSQFRGTLKRRAFVVHAGSVLATGQEVFHESDDTQPCGTVAQAARSPLGGFDAIVSMQLSAASGGRLWAGDAGNTLALQPLPYLLAEDV